MRARSPAPTSGPAQAQAGGPWRRFVPGMVWLYVAALWLLALDQTFRWGLFGPAVAPPP